MSSRADRRLSGYRDGEGEPLVLLHGLGLTWRSWLPVLPALAGRHSVHAFDLPGFGASPPLPDARAPLVGRLADAVERELDAEGVDAAHLVGNSLGGRVAVELAVRGRARSLVALAPSGLELPPERAYILGLNEMMRARAKVIAPVASAATRSVMGRVTLLGGLRARPWRVPPEEAAREVRAFANCPGFQPTLRWTVGADVAARLDRIKCPARLVAGTRDLLLGALTAPRFAAAIPSADLRTMPGTGHVPMADDPSLVARTILEVTAGERG